MDYPTVMKRLQHPLKDDVQHRLPKGLRSLNQQIEHLKKIRQLVLPLLPQGENWQVASYEQGVLCIAAEHHAAASQLRYLQAHYVEQMKTLDYFSGLHRLKVIVETAPTPRKSYQAPLPKLSADTKQLLLDTAGLFDDPELSEALLRIASKK
ncbi:MAG: hypothetical protein RL180_1393 [Pseudomonadota bacterium]